MKRLLALLTVTALVLVCLTCKKDPEVNKVRVDVIEGEKVFNMVDGAVTVRFQGTYSLSNSSVTVRKMTLALGQDASLADANVHQATLNDTVFSVKVDGLSANATYYYRYQVDYGASTEYKTEIKHFETPSVSVPSVTTAEVTEYTATTAQCGGKVTSTGGSEVTERGVCWSTDHNPGVDGDHKASESEGENFMVEVTGLSAETTYYVRAYAKNDAGVGYGEEVSFTTAQVQGFLVSVSANPSEGGVALGGGEYVAGAECTVRASANDGYDFVRWTENDALVSDRLEYTFFVAGNRNLVAQFQVKSYTVSVSAEPHEGGTVSGGGEFHYGDECTLTATAAQGYRFVNWTRGDFVVFGDPVYTFPVTESASYVAHFQVVAFDLDVTADPTVIPQGGNSQLEAAALGGNGNFTYSWSPSSSLNNAAIHNPTASPTTTTTYTCTVTSGGQTGSGSCTVNVVCPPTTLTAIVQNNSDVVLSWPATDPASSYKVYKDNALVASNVTETTYRDSGLNPGTYTYQVSAVYQYVESPKSSMAQATIYNSLSVTATANPNTIPEGGSSTLTANATGGIGSYTYSWTPTTGLNNTQIQSPTATPSSTTTYTVTVESGGQTATATVKVDVVKVPTGLAATVQNTNNVHLSWNAVNPATNYKVYRDNTVIAQNVNTPTYNDNNVSSGTHSYQVSTVYQGVESPKSDAVQITVNSALSVTATATPSVIPFGNSSTLTANVTGGSGSYTYSWSPTTGLSNSHVQSPTATPTSSTSYTVTVSSNGQTASATVTVNVVRAPTSLSATVQNTNNVHLTWNVANPATSYKVYRNNTMIASNVTSTSYNDNNLSSGTYNYQVSAVYQGVESPKSSSTQAIIENGSWLYYGGNNYVIGSGLSEGGELTWAVMFPPSTLTPYAGTSITKFKGYFTTIGTYTLKIYRGGSSAPSTLIHSQNVSVTSVGWKEVSITPLSLTPTQSLWVSLTITHQAGAYPACKTTGVNDPNARWACLSGYWIDLGGEDDDFSWMIRVYVTSAAKGEKGLEIKLPHEPLRRKDVELPKVSSVTAPR